MRPAATILAGKATRDTDHQGKTDIPLRMPGERLRIVGTMSGPACGRARESSIPPVVNARAEVAR